MNHPPPESYPPQQPYPNAPPPAGFQAPAPASVGGYPPQPAAYPPPAGRYFCHFWWKVEFNQIDHRLLSKQICKQFLHIYTLKQLQMALFLPK